MKEELFKKQNEISELSKISDYTYERIFNLYKSNTHFAYNILRTVHIPADLDDSIYFHVMISGKMTWTQVSFEHYGTIRLWWLLCLANGILNPVLNPDPGTVIKIIKRDYVNLIVQQINSQL